MKELKFADVGEGITEGHVQKWLFKDGDRVKEDQPVVTIETDKAVVSIPSPASGILRIAAKENSDIKVGSTLAYVLSDSDSEPGSFAMPSQAVQAPVPEAKVNADKDAQAAAQTKAVPANQDQHGMQQTQTLSVSASGKLADRHEVIAAPYARKLAREMGIDISQVQGSGPNGKITEEDLKKYSSGQNASAHAVAQPKQAANEPEARVAQTQAALQSPGKYGPEKRIQMSQVRRTIAKNMELSWTIPRAAHMDMFDATALFAMVMKEKERAKAELGVRLTFLPFIIKAVIAALKEKQNMYFNSSFDASTREVVLKEYYNIGLAAASPDGLKVIVIKNADRKSIIDIAKEISSLAEKVQNSTISIDEMRGSTFTITNIGSLKGGFFSVPMINYPEAAILGVHLIRDWPWIKEGMVKIGKMLSLSLTFDHRVVDGADAVRFMNSIMEYLGDPDFLEML